MNAISTTSYGPLDRTRSALAIVTVLLAAVLATLFGQAPSAHASGTADYPVTLAGASSGQVPLASAWAWGTGYVFTVPALDVQPSTVSSALQHVNAYYEVQAKSVGSTVWQTVATASAGADLTQWVPNPWDNPENDSEMLVAAGKRLPAVQFPTLRTTTTKHYRVVVTVSWSVPDTSMQLGARTLEPKVTSDLKCQAAATRCQVVQVPSPVFLLKP